jgi:uncharacterized protein YraI
MKRTAWLAAAILAVLTAVPLFAAAAAENYEWPKAGFVTGSRVNLRNGPSTSAKVVGQFGHDYETGELVVTGTEKTGEEFPWYRVLSHQFGEGWIYGKFLSVEETDSTVRRYVMKIREDFGISPALAVKMYGEPMKREERKVKLPDFNATVHIVDLFFHGHTATYWNGALQAVDIPAGFRGFGASVMGMDAGEALSRRGAPSEKESPERYFYIHERDEIDIMFDRAPEDGGGRVTGLHYRRVVYD